MATLTASRTTLGPLAFIKGFFEAKQPVHAEVTRAIPQHAALFQHALAALSAKLAVIDGPINKSEYHAFEALFIDARSDADKMRRHFVTHLDDRAPALQFARQIMQLTGTDAALRQRVLSRLFSVAASDALLNAAELEFLRAVADAFGLARDEFRSMAGRHLVPTTSPYDVLGVPANISDDMLRARYMAKVQMLHPDRYLAAGASAETVALLSDQLAAVNAAYQQVRAERAKKTASKFGRKTMKGAAAA